MANDQEVMGSNPGTIYWMDVSEAIYYIHMKITKIKVAKKKIFKKMKFLTTYLDLILFNY
jgi:hypothetical protein